MYDKSNLKSILITSFFSTTNIVRQLANTGFHPMTFEWLAQHSPRKPHLHCLTEDRLPREAMRI